MRKLRLEGPSVLGGTLEVPCAKNSILPLLAAAVLCDTPTCFENVPALSDVGVAQRILEDLGCAVRRQGRSLTVFPAPLRKSEIDPACMKAMRSGIFFMAPVLARTGSVRFGAPGGCDLGVRAFDIHLDGLKAMGAQWEQEGGVTVVRAPYGLSGCEYSLRLSSVGATETLLMAACMAEGFTRLNNAAVEPEVLDLVRFLNVCGAQIERSGMRQFCVSGVPSLAGCRFLATGDRIWAATVLCAAAGTGGRVTVTNCRPENLSGLPALLQKAGCTLMLTANSLTLESSGRLAGVGEVLTAPFPGFATDSAPLLGAALLRARGATVIRDTLFSHRFGCVQGFQSLGASARVKENALTVGDAGPLSGCALTAGDLRGGAALALAALQAQGTSLLDGCVYIDRGYEDIAAMFTALGASAHWVSP